MKKAVVFCTTSLCIFFAAPALTAQMFRVQMAAYSERQPDSFFKEKGVDQFMEILDAGIYWYWAGRYNTFEEAEAVQLDVISKGFPYAIVIDEEAQRVLAATDCPYIRDGVVYIHDPNYNPNEHTIYFESGSSGLSAEAKDTLNEVYRKLKQKPGLTLKIQGFTDGVGDGRANLELAAVRSRAARDYLIYKGVRADKMFMEIYGEANPAAPNAEDDGSNAGKGRDLPGNRKWNRRVTLTLTDPANTPKTNK